MRWLSAVTLVLGIIGDMGIVYAGEKMRIEIISVGQIDNSVQDYLKEDLSDIFNADVSLSETQPLPEYAFNKKRRQYLSSVILQKLLNLKKQKAQKVLAVIDKDLYVPQLNFVFGEADIFNGVCIISITRLRQSYYGLREDKDLFLRRCLKEAVHEIGHLLNLGHCSNRRCVMYFSNSLLDTDRKDYHFCDSCKSRLPRTRKPRV